LNKRLGGAIHTDSLPSQFDPIREQAAHTSVETEESKMDQSPYPLPKSKEEVTDMLKQWMSTMLLALALVFYAPSLGLPLGACAPQEKAEKKATVEKKLDPTWQNEPAKAIVEPIVYIVVKGDNLTKLGKKFELDWRSIRKANQIKDPNLILIGQKLVIPKPGSMQAIGTEKRTMKIASEISASRDQALKAKVKTPARTIPIEKKDYVLVIDGREYDVVLDTYDNYRSYRNINRNPFRGGNIYKVIDEIPASDAIRKQFKEAYKQGGKSDIVKVPNGIPFRFMACGKGERWRNFITDWKDGEMQAARPYLVRDGELYHGLVEFLWCKNPSYIVLKPRPKPEPPKAVVPPVVAPPITAPPKFEKPPQLLIPPAKTEPPVERPKPRAKLRISPDFETIVGAGITHSLHGSGHSDFQWGLFRVWLTEHDGGRMHEGVAGRYSGYSGVSGSGFSFSGHKQSLGGVVDYNDNPTYDSKKDAQRIIFTGQYGNRVDHGMTSDSKYAAGQDTDILHFNLGHDWYRPKQTIYKTVSWLDLDIDVGHKKTSTWEGRPIPEANDPAGNKTEISAGSRLFFWKNDKLKIKGGAQIEGDHAIEDRHIAGNIGPFISDPREMIIGSGKVRYETNSKYEENNNKFSGILDLNFDLGQALKRLIRGSVSKAVDKKNTKEELTPKK
jgi:LysM repeat protein